MTTPDSNSAITSKTIILFGDSLTQFGYGVENKKRVNVDDDDNKNETEKDDDDHDDGCIATSSIAVASSRSPSSSSLTSTYTIGWASLLAMKYVRRVDVVNRGYRGYTTKMAISILPKVFPIPLSSAAASQNPSSSLLFATVWFGANDSVLPEEGKRHVPIQEYGDNLKTIIEHIRRSRMTTTLTTKTATGSSSNFREEECKKRKSSDNNGTLNTSSAAQSSSPLLPLVILLTPPPVDAEKYKRYCIQTFGNNPESLARARRSNESVKLYVQKVIEIGQVMDCNVIDVFTMLGGYDDSSVYTSYLSDGVHLTQPANIMVYERLMELLERKYPQLTPDSSSSSTCCVPIQEKDWIEYFE